MIRLPPRSTRTATLFPDPTLFRSAGMVDLYPDAAAREFRPPSLRERDERPFAGAVARRARYAPITGHGRDDRDLARASRHHPVPHGFHRVDRSHHVEVEGRSKPPRREGGGTGPAPGSAGGEHGEVRAEESGVGQVGDGTRRYRWA